MYFAVATIIDSRMYLLNNMAVVTPNMEQVPVEGSQYVTVLAVTQRFPQKFSFTPTQNSL